MTLTEPVPADPTGTEPLKDAPARRGRSPLLALGALYLAATAIYVVLGLRAKVPLLVPDELEYKHLAESLAHGHGFDWRGDTFGLRAALYVYAIAPAWVLANGE